MKEGRYDYCKFKVYSFHNATGWEHGHTNRRGLNLVRKKRAKDGMGGFSINRAVMEENIEYRKETSSSSSTFPEFLWL